MKKKKTALSVLSLAALACAVACASARTRNSLKDRFPASVEEKPSTLTVVALTDFHGALEPELVQSASGEMVSTGGAATLSSYIRILKQKTQGPLVILDGGDLFQGTLLSNYFEGAPVIRFYNYLGVTAAALGNHEFDFGPIGDKAVPRDPSDDAQGALKERMKEGKFPILAINVVDKTGKRPSWLRGSIVVEQQGVKIGIIGAASVETPMTTNAANLEGLTFVPELEPIREEALRMRNEEKVQSVLLAIHAGGGCKNNDHQDDLASCESGEGYDLIHQLPEGLIDVVVAGHTHKGVAKRIKKTVMLQPFARGKQLGWAEVPLTNRDESPRVAGWTSVCASVLKTDKGFRTCIADTVKKNKGVVEPSEFLGVRVEPDAAVDELLRSEIGQVQAMKDEPLGIRALDDLTRKYYGENTLGNLVADALKDSMEGIDVGMTNGGGLRANIQPRALRFVDIFEVLPFDNQLAKITVNGATLRKMVELGHSGGQGGLSWSGLSFEADDCKIGKIMVSGRLLDPNATYRVMSSDYLATGGSGFKSLNLKPEQIEIYWDRPALMRDTFARVLKKWGKDLRSTDYFDPSFPRNRVRGKCGTLGD